MIMEKWNESGLRPLLCTYTLYRLQWARRTSWGWWDEWDDTALQTHDLKFTEAPHNTELHEWMGKKHFCFFPTVETGKWNKSGFRPPLCTYRLNWARRTSKGRWDEWDDTVLQTQDSKFEPWRSEAEHATSRSRRLPTILTFTLTHSMTLWHMVTVYYHYTNMSAS